MTAARGILNTTGILDNETRYWPVSLVRASIALAAGLVITFSPNHSVRLGLWVFGAFALTSGIALVAVTVIRTGTSSTSITFVVQGVLTAIAGAAAVAFATTRSPDLGVYVVLVTAWAAVTGCLELYCALRAGRASGLAREWLLVGGLSALLALVLVLLPMDAVAAVGLFGAYGIVIGVYLMIGALTLKWAPAQRDQQTSQSGEDAE